MSLAVIHSRALDGLDAPEVTVEVHLANGLPSFTLVGLADTEVKEARERVRAALHNSGLDFPHNKRITVNLAPADLPKESGRFDLPIALGILAASGQIDAQQAGAASNSPASCRWPASCGRCAARWRWRWRCAAARSTRALVLPRASAREAALVEGLPMRAARTCSTSCSAAAGRWRRAAAGRARGTAPRCRRLAPDLRDVKGQAAAKRALEIAAAGGHSLLMVGPPGTGKSMLAQRFARPAAAADRERRRCESAAVLSLAGALRRRSAGASGVLRAPHHSASSAALVGGGSPPRPGEISLAHDGVLFLDELPEFPRAALEALREPLETGRITISRAARQAEFPGALPAGRRDESLPLRAPRQPAASVPLHARRDRALPGPHQRAAARPHRPPGRGARRAADTLGRGGRRRDAAPTWRARVVLRAPACSSRVRAASTRARPVRASTSTARSRRRRRSSCKQRPRASAGRRAAFTACCASRAPSPTWPAASAIQVAHVAEAIQYRRVLSIA